MLFVRAAMSASIEELGMPHDDSLKSLKVKGPEKLRWEDHQHMHDDHDGS